MSLTITRRKAGEIVILDVRGRITFGDECNLLRNEVKEVLASKPLGVVLNLSQVVYMDSGGIGTMVALYTSAHAAGSEIKIASPTERVKYVLDITKLTPILGVFPSEERAFASMQRPASA
jgi:anti-sigma B factor antagonist